MRAGARVSIGQKASNMSYMSEKKHSPYTALQKQAATYAVMACVCNCNGVVENIAQTHAWT